MKHFTLPSIWRHLKPVPAALTFLTLLTGFLPCPAAAQDAAAGARALGVVTKIDEAQHQVTVKNDSGTEVAISLDAKTNFRRVAPGETSLKNASVIALADVHPGDRVLARGQAGATPNSLTANLIVVMSQADIANRQATDRADWERRGITGLVTESAADHVTVQSRTLEGVRQITIVAAPDAVIRRYAPDSVKFADAQKSTLADIKKGDQVRARGDRTADGLKMTAEEIVSGVFRVIAGVITELNPAENTIRITSLETKKPMTVRISADSTARKLPLPLAQAIANRLHGMTDVSGRGAAAPAPAASPAATNALTNTPSNSGAGRGDLQQMFDRAPAVTLADLKNGDAIIVSSTVGATNGQVTAITLFAGVEPILTKPGTREMSLGDWSVGSELAAFGQ